VTHVLTMASGNTKTGPIPVSTSPRSTCPDACALKGSGCYAEHGPLAWHWKRISARPDDWRAFLQDVRRIPARSLWRFAQAGDLPGAGDVLDVERLDDLVRAQRGRRGFTYTHKPLDDQAERAAVTRAQASGFTINLSADTPAHADRLLARRLGPVVVLLPEGARGVSYTPGGAKIVVCPAYKSERVNCQSCELCALPVRKYVIGFPVHGTMRAKAGRIAMREDA
jgi:hypothetical protein